MLTTVHPLTKEQAVAVAFALDRAVLQPEYRAHVHQLDDGSYRVDVHSKEEKPA
jgi:hypothetical protein